MKYNLILSLFLLSISLILPSYMKGGTSKDKHTIGHSIMRNVGQALSAKHQMHMCGIREASHRDDKRYTLIGLSFQIQRPVSKEEGRKLLIECAEELLSQINSHPDFRPFLHDYPFPVQNIQIDFFVSDETGRSIYHPGIAVFSLHEGKLGYYTNSPEKEHGYFSKEKEAYEEALRIVQGTE